MARQTGILKVNGTLGDFIFYATQDGALIRRKGAVSASRVANDPAFIRTRENAAEFASASRSGKLLRDTLRTMMSTASDNRICSRATQTMIRIQLLDPISARGKRNVGNGMSNPIAKTLVKNLDFNKNANIDSILNKASSVNTNTGTITINELTPLNDINAPEGATHFTIKGAWARIDFTNAISEFQPTNQVNLALNTTTTNIELTPTSQPTGSGHDFFLLQIEFLQAVNGTQYPFLNSTFNALNCIELN